MATRATVADARDVSGRGSWLSEVGDFCRQRPLGAIGAVVVVINILVGLGANVIAPYDPLATDYGAMLSSPSAGHWLGTDAFGRDVLSRIIYGSRTAMLVGFACAFFGATVGAVIGVNALIPHLTMLAEILFRVALLMTLFSAADYLRRGKRMLIDSAAAA